MKLEDIYHETCLIEIELEALRNSGLVAGKDYVCKQVEVKDYDYSKHAEWVAQRIKSNKEYKKLKEIEFKIIRK